MLIAAKALTSLKAHQSRTKPLSLNSLSSVVLLKSRGQEFNLHSGFTSSCSFTRAVENSAVLPILKTTLGTETLQDKLLNYSKPLLKQKSYFTALDFSIKQIPS